MSTTARVVLERGGAVTSASGVEPSGNGLNYGRHLPYLVDHLDDLCESLGVTPASRYFHSPGLTDHEPTWHEAVDGLATFTALLTELIFRIDSDQPWELSRANTLWEVRAFELVLRDVTARGERFYIEI